MDDRYLENEIELRRRVERRLNLRRTLLIHAGMYVVGMVALTFASVITHTGTWLFIPMLGWGAGLLIHSIWVYFEIGPPAKAIDRRTWQAMGERYGDLWRTEATKEEYNDVRRQVSKPFERRKGFTIHLGVFLTISLLQFLMMVVWGFGSIGISLAIFGLWGFGVAIHGAQTFIRPPHDHAIEREVERERERLERELASHKRKRAEERLQLSAGDELDIVYDDEDAWLSGRDS